MRRLQKNLRPFFIVALLLIFMGVSAQTTQLPPGSLYALDGTTALVYNKVYVRSGNSWVYQATLLPDRPLNTGVFGERYGTATALQGDIAVITSYGHELRADSEPEEEEIPGSLFIFKHTGTTWDFQQEISFNSNFGQSVDLDGNTIIVSNEGNYDGYENTVAFVEYDGSTWSRTETFVTFYAPGSGRVAISGDLALAYGEIDSNTPITRTYRRSSGVWLEQDSLPAGFFDISLNTAVINRDVYVVYIASGSVWTLVTTLVPDEPFNPSGNGAAIKGNNIIIADSAKSFIFSRSSSDWTQQQKLTVDGADVGFSGASQNIAVSAAFALVAPYVFDLNIAPGSQNLLFNGDFEINADNNAVPDGWSRKNTTADERRCNQPGQTPVAFSGNCTYFLKGGTGGGKLAQNIDLNVHSLNAGDKISLIGFYNKQGAGDVNVWLYVSYSNQPQQQARVFVRQTTSGYKALPSVNLTLNGTPTRVRVVIENLTTSGKMWVDALSLQKTTASTDRLMLLELPTLPETEDNNNNSRALPLPLPTTSGGSSK